MRKLAIFCLLVLGVSGFAALAGDTEAKVESAKGEIVAVDAEQMTVTVKTDAEKSESITFKADENTKITKAGAQAKLEDISAGDRVTVDYKKGDGQQVAVSIGIG
jgi:Cu/Ag efflux protein CusF